MSEVAAIVGSDTDSALKIIERFRSEGRFFISITNEPNPLVNISHESLISGWQSLSDWVDEEAQSARLYRRLAETAELQRQGMAELLRGPELQLMLEWYKANKPNRAWALRYFFDFDSAMDFLRKSRGAREKSLFKSTLSLMFLAFLLFISIMGAAKSVSFLTGMAFFIGLFIASLIYAFKMYFLWRPQPQGERISGSRIFEVMGYFIGSLFTIPLTAYGFYDLIAKESFFSFLHGTVSLDTSVLSYLAITGVIDIIIFFLVNQNPLLSDHEE